MTPARRLRDAAPALAILLGTALAIAGGAPDAAAEDLRCTLCADDIRGAYVSFTEAGVTACATCAATEPCSTCGLPLAGRNRGEDSHCARCIDRALRCTSCGLPIFDRYWEVAGASGQFCRGCRKLAPACASCGVPTRTSVARDGRLFCPACDRRRVDDGEVYEAVYRRVRDRARTRLGMVLRDEVPLVVQSAQVIGDHPGLPEERDGLAGLYLRDENGNASIHVISNLTESRLVAVLAHELAHAWQAEHCPENQSLRVREGFAEWVAWHLVGDEPGGEQQREIIARRTDEYGRGFRLIVGLEAQGGTEFAMWWVRHAESGADGAGGVGEGEG